MVIRIDAGDMVMAMTSGDEIRWYLDTATGAVEPDFDSDELERPGREARSLMRISSLDSREAFRIMERFAADVRDEEVRSVLEIALAGRGAFRRFKDAVRRWPDIASSWYAYHHDAVLAAAREWLEYRGIEAILAAPPQPESPPVSQESNALSRGVAGHRARITRRRRPTRSPRRRA